MTFFRKNNGEEAVCNKRLLYPLNTGEVISLEKVNNSVISSLIVGNGFAVLPDGDNVYSPVSGVVKGIENNNRAITVKTDDGLIVVIHIGTILINAPYLEGTVLQVELNQHIEAGQVISKTDFEKVKADGRDTALLMIISNFEKIKSFKVNYGLSTSTDKPIAEYELEEDYEN